MDPQRDAGAPGRGDGMFLNYVPGGIGLVAIIFLTVMMNFFLAHNKSNRIDYDSLMEEESNANRARRKDIGPEHFVKPDLDKLPFTGFSNEEAEVKKRGSLPMIRFDKNLNNNELKYMFGVANLDEITRMEENFTEFIRAMFKWAEELVSHGVYDNAVIVLNETVRLKSELSKSYTLLADIYKLRNDEAALKSFAKKISTENFFRDNIQLKTKVLNHLNKLTTREEGGE